MLLNAAAVDPQFEVKHTPYVQLGNAPLTGLPGSGTDQMEILWQTIPAGTGTQDSFAVEYHAAGDITWTGAGPISTIVTGVEGRINHFATITGLAYDSDYEYRVRHLRAGVEIMTYGDTFHTRLAAGDNTPFTFASYGDSASGSPPTNFIKVQNRINQVDATEGIAFSVLLGDNVYSSGSHSEFDRRLDPAVNPALTTYNKSHIDYYGMGNHDAGTNSGQPSLDNYSVPIPVAGVTSPVAGPVGETAEKNYSFDYGMVHFATFDTNGRHTSRLDNQLDWLVADMGASNARWKVVFGHHPIAGSPDKGENPGQNYYQQVVSRLRAAEVDLFMMGHSHLYHWTYPLLGEDGAGNATFVLDTDKDYAKGAGLVQIVAGTGGAGLRNGTFTQFPFNAAGYSLETTPPVEHGFARVDVTPNQLTVSYVAADDGAIIDFFTITDGPDTSAPTASIVAPADNGPDDLDPDVKEILVAGSQPSFQIQLSDIGDGIDDSTVTSDTVSVTKDVAPLAVNFSYDAVGDLITLTATGGGDFGEGVYQIAVSEGAAKIKDLAGNDLVDPIFTVEITGSLPTLTFQQGVAGYTGAHDTFLHTGQPDIVKGGNPSWEWDTLTGTGSTWGLVRFDDIFGGGPGQIPVGATVLQATLNLVIPSSGAGGVGNVHEVAVDWDESSVTTNNFGPIAGIQTGDYRPTQIATAPGSVGTHSINVTASLQAWAADPNLNHGWIFLPTSSNGTDVHSSEYTVPTEGPQLVVMLIDEDPVPGPPTVVDVLVRGPTWAAAGLAPFSIPVGSGVQLRPLPWINIDQVSVQFSENVSVDQSDLTLNGVNLNEYNTTGFMQAGTTATWTLAAPIDTDKLLIELNADGPDPVRDDLDNVLDGEWTNPANPTDPAGDMYPSGNGTPGGDFRFRLNVLPADVNGDTFLNVTDVGQAFSLVANLWTLNRRADINADGFINVVDVVAAFAMVPDELPAGEPAFAETAGPLATGTVGSNATVVSAPAAVQVVSVALPRITQGNQLLAPMGASPLDNLLLSRETLLASRSRSGHTSATDWTAGLRLTETSNRVGVKRPSPVPWAIDALLENERQSLYHLAHDLGTLAGL